MDTDPGYGLGTVVPITPGADLSNVMINIDPTTLTQGIHVMGLRAKDANGSWGLNQKWLFIKPFTTSGGSAGAVPNITNVEYYIDADPGYGLATTVGIVAGTELSNQTINLDPTSLTQGIHIMGLRAKDANGVWSLNQKWLFIKPYTIGSTGAGPVPNITKVEYFIDADPGFGNATSFTVTQGTDISGQTINVNPSNLTEGIHILGLRAQDANGSWGLGQKWLFIKPYSASLVPPVAKTIKQVEYYVDTDPGFGKANPVAIQNLTDLSAVQLSTNVTGLAVGSHKLYIRGRDNTNAWGFSDTLKFTVPAVIAAPAIEVNSISKTTAFCAQDSVTIGFQATGTFNSGNIFTAYLSDANGSFATEQPIGNITSTTSGLLGCRLISHLPEGTGYKIRIKSNNTLVTGNASVYSLSIHDRPYAQTITGDLNVNAGYLYPYSVPAIATSAYAWVTPSATIAQNANAANITWNTVGQPQSLQAIETNMYGCVGDTSTKAVNVYPLKITGTTPNSLAPCPASSFSVSANASGVFYAGNTFTAQLSDANGSFASPTIIGTLSPTTQPLGNNQPISISGNLPFPIGNGNGYKTRILANNFAVTSDTSASIAIQKPNLGADVQTTVSCVGGTADITTIFNTAAYVSVVYNTPTPTASLPGNYTLIVTNSNGCKDTAAITVTAASDVPVASNGSSIKLADRECTDATGWTHYYNNNGTPTDFSDDIRLLSLKKNGQNIGSVGDGTFQVKVAATAGAGSNKAVVVNSPIVTNQLYGMNRYWSVTATAQPLNAINVRFYYNTQDLADVNGTLVTLPHAAISQTQLLMYKIVGGNPDPTSNFAGATDIVSYLNGSVPDASTWVYTSLGNDKHQAEFAVSTLSGGGMGATANGMILPITLLNFTGSERNGLVKLLWTTSSETNSKQFVIQRSADDINFTNIGIVAAAGNSTSLRNYNYNDLLAGTDRQLPLLYYRLQMIDIDGKAVVSDVQQVKLGSGENFLALQYNPVSNEAILNYNLAIAGKVSFRVTDASGRTVLLKETSLQQGANQISLNTSALSKGIYTIEAIGNTDHQFLRMVKQ